MATKKFVAEVKMGHKGCAIILPFDPSEPWGERARQYVRGTLNGLPFDGEIGHRWGRFFMVLGNEILTVLGVQAGDSVQVSMASRKADMMDAPKLPRLPSARLRGPSAKARKKVTGKDK